MKSIILLFSIIGIIFVAIGYFKSNQQCPPSKVQYRYIPRTFNEEQNVHTPLLSISGVRDMFEKSDAWSTVQGYEDDTVYR